MGWVMKHSCCDYRPPAPTTEDEAVDQIFTHQREYHAEDAWSEFTVTMIEENDGNHPGE